MGTRLSDLSHFRNKAHREPLDGSEVNSYPNVYNCSVRASTELREIGTDYDQSDDLTRSMRVREYILEDDRTEPYDTLWYDLYQKVLHRPVRSRMMLRRA